MAGKKSARRALMQRKYTVEEIMEIIKPLKRGSKARCDLIRSIVKSGKSPLASSQLYSKIKELESNRPKLSFTEYVLMLEEKERLRRDDKTIETKRMGRNLYERNRLKNRTDEQKAKDGLRSRARYHGVSFTSVQSACTNLSIWERILDFLPLKGRGGILALEHKLWLSLSEQEKDRHRRIWRAIGRRNIIPRCMPMFEDMLGYQV